MSTEKQTFENTKEVEESLREANDKTDLVKPDGANEEK